MEYVELSVYGNVYRFENVSNEDTSKIFEQLSGAKILNKNADISVKNSGSTEQMTKDTSDLCDSSSYDIINPTTDEIKDYILAQPNYEHSVKAILSYYNNGKKYTLGKNATDELFNIWNSVSQRTSDIRDSIKSENVNNGKWEGKRVGKGKVFLFVNE
ncbi:hypothetical protein [Methanolobus vulcani]|uniref:Uncharacterized protein n=1 Tax=Methanolobus vulcani TaxID=38026 RepID=A0A7Z8P1Q1_9EURY|nr:hypothetical protein [Methanolobus vulcani]TQD24976.1 hypothetical protein FKV42_07875 [Methanolobus vulcani]